MAEQFFDETTEQSAIKAKIVSDYFWAWAKVIIPTTKQRAGRIGYVDLFAGPGRYKDGTKSTPLLVLEKAIADPDMRAMLVTLFNDGDPTNASSLQAEIAKLPGIEILKHRPVVQNEIVDAEVQAFFAGTHVVPTLFFIDPWGYKGLSLSLIESVLKDWGCDCIFFFNYNRISMGLPNEAVDAHLDALFGSERAHALRTRIQGLSGEQRELAIVEELAQALKDKGGRYVLPFRFKSAAGSRTSHHLVFVSKHVKGYEIMKEIMARESSAAPQGVPSFEYNPAPADPQLSLLFALSRPLEELEGMILEAFAGQSLTMQQVYERHHVDRPYVKKNYKEALRRLEKGVIRTDPAPEKRRKVKGEVTFADNVFVRFPNQEGR
jgi:three-Cys-motif partner protein